MSETKKVDMYLDKFRKLHGMEFRIDKVGKPYRKAFDESTKRFRSFYPWPKDDRQVIESGDAKSIENGASASYDYCREKIWNKETRKMEFHLYDYKKVEELIRAKQDADKHAAKVAVEEIEKNLELSKNSGDVAAIKKLSEEYSKSRMNFESLVKAPRYSFFKFYKKVFDVRVTLKDTATFEKWDKTQVDAKDVMCEAVSASIVRNAIETLTDIQIPLVHGKDKLGKPAMVKPFDWEDAHAKALEGLFAKLKVAGDGMDTKYLILPAAKFVVPEDDFGKDFDGEAQKPVEPSAIPF